MFRKNVMSVSKFVTMEIDYIKNFSDCRVYEHYLEFSDPEVPEICDHNFIMFKEEIDPAIVYNTILFHLEKRKTVNSDFLKVELNTPTNLNFIDRLPIKPTIEYYDCLSIETKAFKTLRGNPHGVVKLATTDEVFKDGMDVAILSNKNMGIDFTTRRMMRKIKAYKEKNFLDFYVCYGGGEAVGHVELGYKGHVAKIEYFDIIPSQRRKGYGTFVLREILHQAYNKGVTEAYLIINNNERAKNMYMKCGFKSVGQKVKLIFDFK